MNLSDAVERTGRGDLVGEDDLLCVTRGCEEPPDGIVRHPPGEEQPVDRAIERELGGGSGKDEEDHISVAPDPAHDGASSNEIGHSPSFEPARFYTLHRKVLC